MLAELTADAQRLHVLTRYGGLDAPPDRALDRITTLASRLFDVPISLVSLVGEDRQVFRSCYGLGITGTSREVSFCTYAVEQNAILVVEDALEDPRFRDNPLVTGDPFIRFYAGAPLVSREGISFGSLCLIDRKPRTLSAREAATLTDLAAMVVDELELRHEMQARLEAEQEILHRETRFRKMLEHSSDIITILGADGTILYESPSVEALLGYTPEELIGTPALSYVHEDDRAMVAEKMQLAMSIKKHRVPLHFRWRHRDGSWVHLEALGTNLFDDPSIGGLLVNSRDISMNRRYEAEHEARTRAEEMLRLQDTLLTNMTHELRTPLTAIVGISTVLADEMSPALQVFAESLIAASNRLERTLTGLLHLAQLEGGTLQLNPVVCDLAVEVEAAAGRASAAAREKGIALRMDLAGPKPAHLDPNAFGRVLDELIGNAVKFTPKGEVHVRLCEEKDGVRVDVQDTGIGIGAAFLPHLFEPFQQESQGLSRAYEGNGVGLALALRLATRMGGTIRAKSALGEGSTFSFFLPGPDWDYLRRTSRR